MLAPNDIENKHPTTITAIMEKLCKGIMTDENVQIAVSGITQRHDSTLTTKTEVTN